MAIDSTSGISQNFYVSNLNNINEQLTSGQRLNQAADGAADQAVVTGLTSQINAQDIAVQNANSGINLVQTADGASQQISESLQRLRELSVQALNGTLSTQQRDLLDTEFQQGLESIQQISENTQFNDINLLDGSNNDINIALGDNGSSNIELPDLTLQNLGLDGSNISSAETASNALNGLDTAIEQLSTAQAQFGAQQNGLASSVNDIQNQNINANNARSQINDTNYARALTDQTRLNILQDASIAMQSQQNQSRSSVLQLLNS